MTVAAVVLVPDATAALADAAGEPALRRVVQSAWAGGAIPLVVVTDAAGAQSLLAAVEDLPVTISTPAGGIAPGSGWFGHGASVAASQVKDTTAALLWPFRYMWVDPETVTSLIEAHGARGLDGTVDDASIVRPSLDGEPGFPILVPIALAARFSERPDLHGFEMVGELVSAGVAHRTVETGDPGILHRDPVPPARDAFHGPPEPAGGAAPEWNEALGAQADRVPLEGPALAPFGQADDVTREGE